MEAQTPDQVAALVAENRRLKLLLDEMAAAAGVPTKTVERPWGLSPQQWAVLCCLAKHSPASNAQLRRVMALQARAPHRCDKALDVVLFHVRRKIAPMGFTISAVWGEGRKLCEPGRAAVRQIMGLA